MKSIFAMALLVDDYDQAIEWYCDALGMTLLQDDASPDGHRFVKVATDKDAPFSLVLTKADAAQKPFVGKQAGEGVVLFLETDDFWKDYEQMKLKSVVFLEQPREEVYGTVAVFEDLYGNRWDLIQPSM